MSSSAPVIFDFDRLRPVTMTVIAAVDVDSLNLSGIFLFLPVTKQRLPQNVQYQKKQGKIRLPTFLNTPGEIISMRYDGQVRGIIRSEEAFSFSHSIIIDIGTSERIVSVKLSKTIEITGSTTFKIAREAAQYVLDHVRETQKRFDIIRKQRDQAIDFMKNRIINKEHSINDKELMTAILGLTDTYPEKDFASICEYILAFTRPLYIGKLHLEDLTCEMANILFDLGFPINQFEFAKVMNKKPFVCNYNNIKNSSAVNVWYHYTKYDRNTGQPKVSKHTIRVNKSGHVRHSGPGLILMKKVYYAFMKRVLEAGDKIKSCEVKKKSIKIPPTNVGKPITLQEFDDIIEERRTLYSDLMKGNIPIATGGKDTDMVKEQKKEILIVEDEQYLYQLPNR